MSRHGRLRIVVLGLCAGCVLIAETRGAFANDGGDSSSSAIIANPWQDDATLRDVATVGERLAWSVGDHGAVWQTTDGGETWRFVPTPASASKTHWSSVCFLSDRVGWIAGGDTEPFTRRSRGALLVTKDGGTSWQAVSTAALPRLRYVRFFDTRQGVIVGEATSRHPTGTLITNDGGKTWLDVVGEPSDGWLAADFLGPHEGLLGGPRGKVSVIVDQRLLPTRVDPSSWRRIRGMRMQRDLTGWLVGDGGLVLKTETGGVTWDVPAGELPSELRDIADFRAVAARGERVWLAGSPGSVIWHSPDGGQTWTKQATRSPVPIESLKFAGDRVGLAVGEFGRILRTIDGGETWEDVRGQERRAAWMSFHLWPEETSCGLIAQQTGEAGYRNIASVLVPSEPLRRAAPGRSTNNSQAGSDTAPVEQRLFDAVLASGGHAVETDERWLISLPDIERQPERLLDAWSKRAEGRFDQILQTRLVVALRMWRPDVIVLGYGDDSDELVRRWREAVLQAVESAADPTQSVGLQEMFGLSGWKVKKVYERRADGSAGDAMVDPHELLPRLRATVSDVAASAASRLIGNDAALSSRHQAYRLLRDETSLGGTFFRGIAHSPGSAARRQLLPLDERNLEQQQKLARRQKNFSAVAERALDNEAQSAALIAELRGHARELSPAQAALELSRLVRAFRDRNQQDLAEATLVELINRYPNEPPALTAAAELIQHWSSAEIAWQRVRRTSVRQETIRSLEPKNGTAVGRISNPSNEVGQIGKPSNDKNDKPIEPKTLVDITDSPLEIGRGQSWQSEQVEHWQQQAIRLSQRLGKLAPELAEQPAVRFPIAALLRQRELPGPAQGIARPFAESPVATPWRRVARRELWLVTSVGEPPNELVRSVPTSSRPNLDGLLSDECWVAAGELRLRGPSSSTESRERSDEEDDGIELIGFNDHNSRPAGHQANSSPQTLAMISHDAQFLYFAASIPHDAEFPPQEPIREGRTHDMDLSRHDRIALFLDIDRDYGVSYSFEIDQRGCTRETCGDDITFNPKWYVATSSEKERWRVEVAIPLNELAPEPLCRKAIWSVGIVRTLPGIGTEGWPATGDQSFDPSWRGLLKLD